LTNIGTGIVTPECLEKTYPMRKMMSSMQMVDFENRLKYHVEEFRHKILKQKASVRVKDNEVRGGKVKRYYGEFSSPSENALVADMSAKTTMRVDKKKAQQVLSSYGPNHTVYPPVGSNKSQNITIEVPMEAGKDSQELQLSKSYSNIATESYRYKLGKIEKIEESRNAKTKSKKSPEAKVKGGIRIPQ